MRKRICTKCKIEKTLETDFYPNKAYKEGYCTHCKECSKTFPSQQGKRKVENALRIRHRNKNFLYSYLLSHPCVDCGESDVVTLEFDHVRGTKFKNLSKMTHGTHSIAMIEKEIAKCDVVCANCHRRRTAKTQNWYESFLVNN